MICSGGNEQRLTFVPQILNTLFVLSSQNDTRDSFGEPGKDGKLRSQSYAGGEEAKGMSLAGYAESMEEIIRLCVHAPGIIRKKHMILNADGREICGAYYAAVTRRQ